MRSHVPSVPAQAPPIVHDVVRSAGRPLEPPVREEMEARFSHDFSRVRVHVDSNAAEAARTIGALAYTVGSDIVFGADRYAPATRDGSRLLAHELAHTIQQRQATTEAEPLAEDSPLELSAEHSGREVASGAAVTHPLGAGPLAVARQEASPSEEDDTEDDRIEEARRRAVAQLDWMLSIPPPAIGDDAPMLIAWAERSATRFHDPATSDSARGYIAMGLMKVFAQLKQFEARAKRDTDGALVYADIGGVVPWTNDRPHSVEELPLFTPESVERWRRVAEFAAADEEVAASGGRRPPKPVRIAPPRKQEVEVRRSLNTIAFSKHKDMTAASDEGQGEIIWLHVAATHPGLTGDQISWVVSRLGLVTQRGERRLTDSWREKFEAAKPGDRITLVSDVAFEQDVSKILLNVPSERDLMLEGYRRGVLDARGGLILAYGTVAVGSLAFGGAAGLGYLGSLGGEVAMSSIAAGGGAFVGGETASFGSFVAAGGRFILTDWYLHPQVPMLYAGGIMSGLGFGEQISRIQSEGWHSYEIGEIAANLLPLAEASVPFLGRRTPSGPGPGPGGDPVDTDLLVAPPRPSSGPSGAGPGGDPVSPDLLIRPARRDPGTGRVTAGITDLGSGRQFDADLDPATQIGQIVDRRSRAVVGIIEGDTIRPPASANLTTGDPDVVAPPPGSTGPSQPSALAPRTPAPAGGGGPSVPRPRPAIAEKAQPGQALGEAVPEAIEDVPTNPLQGGGREGGEQIGDFRIYGEKGLEGDTFERSIGGLYGPPEAMRTTKRGVGPLLRLFNYFMEEASAAGATRLRVTGWAIGNKNFLRMKGLVEKRGGTFRQIDDQTIEIVVPVAGQSKE